MKEALQNVDPIFVKYLFELFGLVCSTSMFDDKFGLCNTALQLLSSQVSGLNMYQYSIVLVSIQTLNI